MVALPIGLKFTLATIAAALGVRIGSRLWHKHGAGLDDALKFAPWLSVVAVVVVLDASAAWLLTLRPDFVWALPLWLQYSATALNWAIATAAMVLLFSVVLSLSVRARDVRAWPLLILAFGSLGAVEWYQASMLERPELRARETPEGWVLQTSGRSCGAATGANIARAFGLQATEREMAERFGTSAGASAAQMVFGLRELGIEGMLRHVRPQGIRALKAPAALFLEPRSPFDAGHIVMLADGDGSTVQIVDPLQGRTVWHSSSLPGRWRGRAIEFQRSPVAELAP
ncbi:MAG: cysteine peptidase family C39 domain-containing protein [Myxococcales bacterium]|nr:cysteine peptidase family C39 domain-containing protein [Myxococcales bacterium]